MQSQSQKSQHGHHYEVCGSQKLAILIVGRIYEETQTTKITKQIIDIFNSQINTESYFMDQKTVDHIALATKKNEYMLKLFEKDKHWRIIDYVVTIGGDGTILYAAKQFDKEEKTPPFLTFQKGTLGFMVQFQLQSISEVIFQAVKRYRDCKRLNSQFRSITMMRLSVELTKKGSQQVDMKKVCVNQIALTRKGSSPITLRIYINKQYLTETKGDGLLISTPTGSTAYALSAGGPIISNGVNSIQIVPMAPYSLSFRPICLPAQSQISIQLSQDSNSDALLSFDGQSNVDLEQKDWLNIKKSNSEIQFLSEGTQREELLIWMSRLKQFLGWNQQFKDQLCSRQEESIKKIKIKTYSEMQSPMIRKYSANRPISPIKQTKKDHKSMINDDD